MGEIIKFKQKDNEDEFMESLNPYQLEQFGYILKKAEHEQSNLYAVAQDLSKKYIKEVQENQKLKKQVELLQQDAINFAKLIAKHKKEINELKK